MKSANNDYKYDSNYAYKGVPYHFIIVTFFLMLMSSDILIEIENTNTKLLIFTCLIPLAIFGSFLSGKFEKLNSTQLKRRIFLSFIGSILIWIFYYFIILD